MERNTALSMYALPPSYAIVIQAPIPSFARSYSSGRSFSSRSYSTRSYSSPRVSSRTTSRTTLKSTPKTSYTSTRTTTKPTSTYKSTRTTTAKRSSYKSTRNTSPITRSNLRTRTTSYQRTTVVHSYYGGYYGYHSFFHPFGMGYYGGDFWFWMYMFDHSQYQQNAQIIQAQNVSAPQHSNFLQTFIFVLVAISAIGCLVYLIRKLFTHLLWV